MNNIADRVIEIFGSRGILWQKIITIKNIIPRSPAATRKNTLRNMLIILDHRMT
jgi:hypothetical protein